MIAHVCWYLPGGEFVCERNHELTPLPRGGAGVWKVAVAGGLGVGVGWRAVLNGTAAFKVSAVGPTDSGVEATLARAK